MSPGAVVGVGAGWMALGGGGEGGFPLGFGSVGGSNFGVGCLLSSSFLLLLSPYGLVGGIDEACCFGRSVRGSLC